MNRHFGVLVCTIVVGVAAPITAQAAQYTFNVPVALSRVTAGVGGLGRNFGINCLPFNVNPATNSGAQLQNYTVVTAGAFTIDATGSFSGTVTEVISTSAPAHGYQCNISSPPGAALQVPPVSGSM